MHLAALLVTDTGGGFSIEQHLVHQGMGDHSQVIALHGRAQIGVRSGPATTVLHGHVHGAEAFLLRTVVIIGLEVTGIGTRPDKGLVERILHVIAVIHTERALIAPVVVAAKGPGLGLPEIGQDVAVMPAGSALGIPFVKIPGVATDIHHAVDGGRSAQHLAPWAVHATVIQEGLRLGLELPGVFLGVHGNGKGGGHLDEDALVAAAGFQQQHPVARVLGQAVGQYTTGGTRTHNDVVVSIFCHTRSPVWPATKRVRPNLPCPHTPI